MPKPGKLTKFQPGHANWNYNWGLIYVQTYMDANGLRYMYSDEKRFQSGNFPSIAEMMDGMDENGQPVEFLLETDEDKRDCPSLLFTQRGMKVGCKTKYEEQSEYKEVQMEHESSLRRRFNAYCAAVDEKQAQMARENPEGASFLRFKRDMANFALQNYGTEAMSDDVYLNIHSQTATIHMPAEFDKDPKRKDFTYLMDQLSDMPFMPVFENSSRMVSIACDHANAARAGTLTARQDRLSRRLLLTQYDHVAGGVLESRRIIRDDDETVAKDYQRWAKAMDNKPNHLSTFDRGPLYVPDNLEGRRIALRQGWPVEDAALLGSLFELYAKAARPLKNEKRSYTPELLNSMQELLEKIGSTRITDAESRMSMLNQIEQYLSENAQKLYLQKDRVKLCFQLRKDDRIQPCQYLSDKELDDAAREYQRRRGLPKVAGSDQSPTGYYEQAVAGTEVLSRLIAMYEIMAEVNKGGRDLTEYNDLRSAVDRLIQSIAGLYAPNPPEGQARAELMDRLNAEHARISRLAETYLSKVRKEEPAFKKAVAQELRSFCGRTARTAASTKEGVTAAENRRRVQDWRIEKDKLASKVEEPKVEEPKVEEPKPVEPRVEEPEIGPAAGYKPKEAEILSGSSEAAPEEIESKPEVTLGSHPTAPVFAESIVQEKPVEGKVEEPKVEEPKVEENQGGEPDPELNKREEQLAFEKDAAAYLKYLDEIWEAHRTLRASPKPSEFEYQAVTERGIRLAELERKLAPLKDSLKDAALDSDGIKKLVELSSSELPDLSFREIRRQACTYYKGMLNEWFREKNLPRTDATRDAAWRNLPDEQKAERAAERIQKMLEGKSFDGTVYSDYATPEQRLEIAEKFLSKEKYDRGLRLSLMDCLSSAKLQRNPLLVYRHLPEVLKAERLHELVAKLDANPTIHDRDERTYLPKADAEAIGKLRTQVESGQYAPAEKDELLRALTDCERYLSSGTREAKEITEQKEKASTDALGNYFSAVVKKARNEKPGVLIDRNGPVKKVGRAGLLIDASDEGTNKVLRMPEVPDRVWNGILEMIKIMDDINLIPQGATEFLTEEAAKLYGFRGVGTSKQKLHEVVTAGKLEELIDAKKAYEWDYQNIETLRTKAKESFPDSYNFAPDIYVTRRPAIFDWNQIDNPQQAQINGVFRLYQETRRCKVSPEQFMEDFPAVLFKTWFQPIREAVDKTGAKSENFESAVEVLMSKDNALRFNDGDFVPPYHCLHTFKFLADDSANTKEELITWTVDAEAQFLDLSNREAVRYGILALAEPEINKSPFYYQLRSDSIQNLLTVSDQDRDVNRMVGLPGYNADLSLMKPFSLNEYVRSHPIDAVGMKQRLETMIRVAAAQPEAPSKDELLAEGLDACARVLIIRSADRDTEEYKALERLADGLLSQFPAIPSDPSDEQLQEHRAAYHKHRTRMENTLKHCKNVAAAHPLAGFMQALNDAKLAPEQNADFDTLRASVRSLSERIGELMIPGVDGSLPELTPQSREELKELYVRVGQCAARFCASAGNQENLALAREKAEKIRYMASVDLNVLTGARSSDARSLTEVWQRRSLRYDVSDQKPEVEGVGVKRRYAFLLPVAENREAYGFFTPEQSFRTADEDLESLRNLAANSSPAAAKAIRVMEEKSERFKALCTAGEFSIAEMQRKNQEKCLHDWEYNHSYDEYLKEAGFTEQEINGMAKGAFADAIDEYLTARQQLSERNALYEKMEIKPGDPVTLRSGAMSAVADALGIGSLLAASRPVTLIRNGQAVQGVFTDNPVGSDCMNPKENDSILEMRTDTPFSAEALRELDSLQVLDYLCGNANRGTDNLRYSFTRSKDGTLTLSGIQALGSELSFMGCEPGAPIKDSAISVEQLKNVPEALADRVMQLRPDTLKTVLQEFRLPENQIERAAERLKELQGRIEKGRAPDAADGSGIRVRNDEDYGQHSPEDAFLARTIRSEVPKAVQTSLLKHDRVEVRNQFRKDERTLLALYHRAEESDKAVWFGSKEFGNVKKNLLAVGQKYSALLTPNEADRKAGRKQHTPTEEERLELRVFYTRLGESVRSYLLRKENELQQKGSLNQMSQARMKLVREIQKTIELQEEHVAGLFNALNREARRENALRREARAENGQAVKAPQVENVQPVKEPQAENGQPVVKKESVPGMPPAPGTNRQQESKASGRKLQPRKVPGK